MLCFDTVLNKTFINYNGVSPSGSAISKIIESDAQNYHSVYLISEIKKCINDFENLDAIGVNIGPGSFTGIRVCLTVAEVMAGQLDVPLVGVPSVEILSEAFNGAAVFLDARRGNYIYYDGVEAKLIDKADAAALAKGKKIVADTNCCEYFAQEGIEAINYEAQTPDLGAVLAKLTAKKLQTSPNPKEEFHYAKIKPLYLQTPPIMVK